MGLLKKELYDLRYRFTSIILLIISAGYFIIAYHDFFISSINIYEIEAALEHSFLSRFFTPELIMQELEMIISNIDLYIWSQWFAKNFYQVIVLACILFAFPSFSRENEQGTNQFLLMNLTRSQIYTQKLLAGWLALLLSILIGSLLPAILAPFYEFEFSYLLALQYGLHMGIAAFFLYAIVILFSIIFDDTVKPIIASIITFVLLGLIGRLDPQGYIYIYRYMMGVDLFFFQTIAWVALAVILLLAVLIYYLGWKIYSSRDF